MNMRTSRLTFALFIGLVAVGCLPPANSNSNGGGNVNLTTPTPVVTSLEIKYPADGALVDADETVSGTSRNVPAGQKIWVVIYISKVRRYYPQDNSADTRPDGTWNSPTTFGIPTDKGLKFDVLAMTADATAQKAFRDYLQDAKIKKEYRGLEQLPDGATEWHRVKVTRK